MYSSPSYLGGLEESEPHYFQPAVPNYLSQHVSRTPFDRGDGIPVVQAPQPMKNDIYQATVMREEIVPMKSKRNFGACAPCQAMVRNPIAVGNPYGLTIDWSKLGTGENLKNFLADMPTEQKDALASNALAKASLYACEKWGIG